jgi:hypothetical protein
MEGKKRENDGVASWALVEFQRSVDWKSAIQQTKSLRYVGERTRKHLGAFSTKGTAHEAG